MTHNSMGKHFSVLMSVHSKVFAPFLSEAMESLATQTLLPTEIILVKDGPLTPELDEVIKSWRFRLENFKLVALEQNRGLGDALRLGLGACAYDLIARMDADDLCRNDRFEKQIHYLTSHPEIDLVGSWIAEFKIVPNEPKRLIRKVPQLSKDVRRAGFYRSPVNHVTVMFRKKAVLQVGSYQRCSGLEDQHLWSRMLLHGCRFYNIQEPLVFVRVGPEMYARRGGWSYLKSEYFLQRFFLKIGFIKSRHFIFNVLARAVVRLLPNCLRESVFYRRALRHRDLSSYL